MASGEEMKIMEMARGKSDSPWSWAHVPLPSGTWRKVAITTLGSPVWKDKKPLQAAEMERGSLTENVMQVDEQESCIFSFYMLHLLSHTIVLLHSSFSV